jgi:membrane associated rhomboid family serine protease
VTWFFFLVVIGGVAFYFTTPDERRRFFTGSGAVARAARDTARRRRAECAPFYDALRERTSFALVTLMLVALNVAIFIGMIFGTGAIDDPSTLIAWGANVGPRTTHGEWWRLVSANFVHGGPLLLLANLVGLLQLGLLLERLVGHIAFAMVYLAAGVFASLASLVVLPVTVNAGASGAIFGMYGLLLATLFWGVVHQTPATIPRKALGSLAPAAGLFVLASVVAARGGGWVELSGLVTGLTSGLFIARGVSESKPPARRIAAVMSAVMVVALASTVPLRGITDARPEVDRVISGEEQMAGMYRTAVVRFNEGRIPAGALTRLIDRQIVPEVRTARARLAALTGVPREHRQMVVAAEEYLRLREESWRLRSEALQTTNMATLRKADRTEWDSLEAFKRIRQNGA